jgi:hypothetical protein
MLVHWDKSIVALTGVVWSPMHPGNLLLVFHCMSFLYSLKLLQAVASLKSSCGPIPLPTGFGSPIHFNGVLLRSMLEMHLES